jgi:U3 small nucleolar RNA-associated protein 14
MKNGIKLLEQMKMTLDEVMTRDQQIRFMQEARQRHEETIKRVAKLLADESPQPPEVTP